MIKISRTFVLASVLVSQLLTGCTTRYVTMPPSHAHTRAHASTSHADGRPELHPVTVTSAAPSASMTVTVAAAPPHDHYVTGSELDSKLKPIKAKLDRTYQQTDRNTTILECEAGDDAACYRLTPKLAVDRYTLTLINDVATYALLVVEPSPECLAKPTPECVEEARDAFIIVDSDNNEAHVKRLDSIKLPKDNVYPQAMMVLPGKTVRYVAKEKDAFWTAKVYLYATATESASPIGFKDIKSINLPFEVGVVAKVQLNGFSTMY